MNKEEYLDALSKSLDNMKATNKEEVMTKFSNRFKLAEEAGFSDEEAIGKFGSPEEAANGYGRPTPTNGSDTPEEKKPEVTYGDLRKSDFIASLVADDLDFVYSDVVKPTVTFQDTDSDNYRITQEDNYFKIEFLPKAKYLCNIHRGHLKVELPKNIVFGNLSINSVSSHIKADSLCATSLYFHLVSGSVNVETLSAKDLGINLVSGLFEADQVSADNTDIDLVSGNVHFKVANGKKFKVSTVSGMVTVDKGNIIVPLFGGLSGKFKINGETIRRND
jgi:hypothetical protein